MANNPLMIRKAFLATRNVSSGEFLVTERFESESRQVLFYLIDTNSEKIGKNLQKSFQSELVKQFLSTEYFSIRNLEECLHFINKKVATCLEPSNSDLNSLVGLLDGTTLHLSMTGNVEGYLLRKNKINSLTEGLDSAEGAGFFNITSGELFMSDLVVIGNKNIFNRLSLDRIRKTLYQATPRQAVKEFYQILRKSKSLDCNTIIFQAVSQETAEKEDESMPDLLYLDEIVESNLSKFYKKYKPVAVDYYHRTRQITSRLANRSKELAQKSNEKIKNNYAPKTKEVLAKTNSKAIEGITKISGNLKNSGSLKIKPYYGKKGGAQVSSAIDYFKNLLQILLNKKNRRYLYLALVIILIFTAYGKIRFNNQNREVIKKQNDASYAYDKAVETFTSAKEDIGLGKSDGLDKLSEALSLSKTAQESYETKDKASSLLKEIQGKIDEITKTTRTYNPQPLFTFKYDIVTSVVSGSVIFGITGDGKIYSTDSSDKDPRLVGAVPTDLGKPVASTYSDKTSQIYILTDQSKIYAYDEQSQSGAEATIDDGSSWEPAVALASYSGYLYLLDNQSGKIWRHGSTNNIFSAGKTYASSKNTDAKDGTSMAIDGAIFVLKPQGSVIKFSHNIPDTSFVLQSPPKPDNSLAGASELYTDADSQHIFILDSASKRLLRYAKDGQFVNQYALDSVDIKHVLYNPRIQKLWLLSQRDVYEIDL